MLSSANWICPASPMGDVCPVFRRKFFSPEGAKGTLTITALGVYEAYLNGQRVGDFLLAPGWTNYRTRLQVQTYDLTPLLRENNELTVTLGAGWFRGRIAHGRYDKLADGTRLLAQITLTGADGSETIIPTDSRWEAAHSPIRFSDIYDGEVYDARAVPYNWFPCRVDELPKRTLIPQEGPPVTAQERIKPVALIHTPAGETVLDFGQEITGVLEFSLTGHAGDEIKISHAEVLDADGNFYTANLRSARAQLTYICKNGFQIYRPHHTFMGFRYIRLDAFPCDFQLDDFTAVVVHSQMKRAGHIRTAWRHESHETVYTFDIPVPATIILPGQTHRVQAGHYEFRLPCA